MEPSSHQATLNPFRFGLYSKLALTFLAVLTLLSIVYGFLTATLANRYFEATHQRLNRDVAAHIAKFMTPFGNQRVNRKGADDIFFQAMVTNPSVEVYLLDSTGRIELYHAPADQIKRTHVDLRPIHQYIKTHNPKSEHEQTIFSVARVVSDGRMQGYVYVILTSTNYDSLLTILRQNYVVQWGVGTMLITLLAALAIGLLAVYRLTKNLSYVIQRVEQFRQGNFATRIHVDLESELAPLADTFNNMAETLTRNIEDLRKAEQLRRNLVATVSHDLRTPLAAIHGYAETLALKTTLPNEQKQQYVGIILQSTNKLRKLVDELFELSKLEARETQPHFEPFALAELVTEVFTKFQLIAQPKQLSFTCEDCQLPTLCYADVGMMERVLQNLIENAIRYVPKGGYVRIQLSRDPNALTVAVENSIENLSEPIRAYLQIGNTTDDLTSVRPTGAGLGFAIVRKILGLHNTQLTTHIQTRQSIRFAFSLPTYHLQNN